MLNRIVSIQELEQNRLKYGEKLNIKTQEDLVIELNSPSRSVYVSPVWQASVSVDNS